ncbi:MAG TPA: FAD binding domain-containing protein [Candidatus Binatia bacterium]|nr:FAD binding domain-containing protein [Candidatus Binatia bacterium]
MKPPPFDYEDPATLDEALALLAEHGESARPLAGGQSLVPLLNFRLASPAVLIDLNRVPELATLTVEDSSFRVGALVRHRALEEEPAVRKRAPLLALAAPLIGHPQIRARGTLGGSLAHADPAAELPAAAVALDASVSLRSRRGARSVPAGELFASFFETVLAPDELLVSVTFPPPPERTGYAFEEMALRQGDFALAGAAVSVSLGSDGAIASARVVCIGAGSTPVRLEAVEEAVAGQAPSLELFRSAAAGVAELVDPPDDVHAGAGYRRRVLGALVRRGLLRAAEGVA